MHQDNKTSKIPQDTTAPASLHKHNRLLLPPRPTPDKNHKVQTSLFEHNFFEFSQLLYQPI
eukprot:599434-Ditylum_brightwellii.AAC.1